MIVEIALHRAAVIVVGLVVDVVAVGPHIVELHTDDIFAVIGGKVGKIAGLHLFGGIDPRWIEAVRRHRIAENPTVMDKRFQHDLAACGRCLNVIVQLRQDVAGDLLFHIIGSGTRAGVDLQLLGGKGGRKVGDEDRRAGLAGGVTIVHVLTIQQPIPGRDRICHAVGDCRAPAILCRRPLCVHSE